MDTIYVNTSKTIWESLPIWLTAIGTLSAVITSLYFSRKNDQVKSIIKVSKILRFFDDGHPEIFITVRITNVRRRSFNVTYLGFQHGIFRKKNWAIIPLPDGFSNTLPVILNDGEEACYYFSEESFKINHIDTMKATTKYYFWLSPFFIKYYFNTSSGKVIKTRLPKEIREYYHK